MDWGRNLQSGLENGLTECIKGLDRDKEIVYKKKSKNGGLPSASGGGCTWATSQSETSHAWAGYPATRKVKIKSNNPSENSVSYSIFSFL
jgi:hypothetical protein